MQVHAIKIDEQGYLQFQRTENGHWFYAGCPFLTGQCGIHCQFLEIVKSPAIYKDMNNIESVGFIDVKFHCKNHSIQCEKENFVNESGENI